MKPNAEPTCGQRNGAMMAPGMRPRCRGRIVMRILVPVDGSASAGRAAACATALAEGRPNAEITLLNVQNQQTLDVSDISGVTSVGGERGIRCRPVTKGAQTGDRALPQRAGKVRQPFDLRSRRRYCQQNSPRDWRRSYRNGDARFEFLARDGSRLGFDKSNSVRSHAVNPG